MGPRCGVVQSTGMENENFDEVSGTPALDAGQPYQNVLPAETAGKRMPVLEMPLHAPALGKEKNYHPFRTKVDTSAKASYNPRNMRPIDCQTFK